MAKNLAFYVGDIHSYFLFIYIFYITSFLSNS